MRRKGSFEAGAHNGGRISQLGESIARGFAEFLALPSYIILAFLALAFASYLLDSADLAWLTPVRRLLRTHVFADPAATSGLLGTIAGGLMTVTSITISLLLVALQQSAGTLTAQVFDQFLRRRLNQTYFGFFIGLALYSLITLATVAKPFNPIFGATLAFLLTVIALYLLIVLLYTTINQMRPAQIMGAIHDHALVARQCELRLIRRTRRAPLYHGPVTASVRSEGNGFVTRIHADAIARAARDISDRAEVILRVATGSYVAFQDIVAEASAQTDQEVQKLIKSVPAAIILERERDIGIDPGYGVEQLAMIGWTSISTAKSNPAAGLLAIHTLRDILARWSVEEKDEEDGLPIVYHDLTFGQLMDAFESLAVVSSESMQHQAYAEVLQTFIVMYPRLPSEWQERAEDLLLRILSAMGDYVLTRQLDDALTELSRTLAAGNRPEAASRVREAHAGLQESVGRLNSRATRVPEKR